MFTDKSFRRVASCPDAKQLVSQPDPVHEVCDVKVKIADLGNACWSVCKIITNRIKYNIQQFINIKLHRNFTVLHRNFNVPH